MTIVAKRLDGSRCYLVGRQASAQASLCEMGTEFCPKRAQPPIFGPCLLWPNGHSCVRATAELLSWLGRDEVFGSEMLGLCLCRA